MDREAFICRLDEEAALRRAGDPGWVAEAPDDAADVVCWLLAGGSMGRLAALFDADARHGLRLFGDGFYGIEASGITDAQARAVSCLTGGALSYRQVMGTVFGGAPSGTEGASALCWLTLDHEHPFPGPVGACVMEYVRVRRGEAGRETAAWLALMLCVADMWAMTSRASARRDIAMARMIGHRMGDACRASYDGADVIDALAASGIPGLLLSGEA